MNRYSFRVDDSSGLWGDMRIDAQDVISAESEIRATLNADEVKPNGSLLPNYTLSLYAVEEIEG